MTGALRLVDGGIHDVDAMVHVMEDSFDPTFGEAWTAPQCAGLLPLPGVWLTLAMHDQEPIGFALSRIVADEAELLLLAVRKSGQRQGIGRHLLNDFAQKARTKGATTLHLEMRDGNPASVLYQGFGFVEVGRRRKYYIGCNGEAFDAITLLKQVGI